MTTRTLSKKQLLDIADQAQQAGYDVNHDKGVSLIISDPDTGEEYLRALAFRSGGSRYMVRHDERLLSEVAA